MYYKKKGLKTNMNISDIKTKEDIKEILMQQQYFPSKEIVYTLYNAIKLDMPILIEGPAGVGKTEIAKVLENAFDMELVRVQCYEGLDYSKTLYEWGYPKQMLTINALQSVIKSDMEGLTLDEAINALGESANFFDDRFLLERPLLKSINGNGRKVLLIDELDKSDEEFEALLLEFLAEFAVTIPEYKTIKCPEDKKPIVILTSNAQRSLSEALRRRCAYLYIDYPSEELEANIIEKKAKVDSKFAEKVAHAVAKIRSLEKVKQKPSISESIIWAQSLIMNLNVEDFNIDNKEDIDLTLNVLLKNKRDIEAVKESNYLQRA